MEQAYVLVSAPTAAGEHFIKLLQIRKVPFVALVNNAEELARMEKLGIARILRVDTMQHDTWQVPEFPVDRVYLFEKSMNLTCRYLRMCRNWTIRPIYVITGKCNPRSVYRGLGANHILVTNGADVSFLLQEGR